MSKFDLLTLEELLGKLIHTYSVASDNFEIYRLFAQWVNQDDNRLTFEKYQGFFVTAIRAHFESSIVDLCCLFEKKKNTVHLYKLRDALHSLPSDELAVQGLVANVDDLLQAAEPLVRKFVRIRSNTVSHIAAKGSFDFHFDAADINIADIEALLANTQGIFSLIGDFVGESVERLPTNATAHASDVLNAIRVR